MSVLWVRAVKMASYLEEHAEHSLHPHFKQAGLRDAPCAASYCPNFDQAHSDAFDDAEVSQFEGRGKQVDLDLKTPLHGFENTLSEGPRRPAKSLPAVFRHQGKHYIMDGHNRLTGALRDGLSHYRVTLHDLDEGK